MREYVKTMVVAFLLGVAAGLLLLALTGCSGNASVGWPESAEFSTLESGQDRFSAHDTNLSYWEVIVDHRTGAAYLYRYKYGVTPLLSADGTPVLVAEAGS